MGEFFKGWRRKIGVVTLVIALLATGGWIRSLYTGDIALLALGPLTLEVASRQREFRFVVYRYFDKTGTGGLNGDRTGWNLFEVPPPKPRDWRFRKVVSGNPNDEVTEKWEWGGIAVAKKTMPLVSGRGLIGQREAIAMSSYNDYVAVSMMLTSMWLLLTKRKSCSTGV